MSGMSQLAVLIYGLVVCACLAAMVVAARAADRRSDGLHWLVAAALFAGLIALRLAGFEDRLRDMARGWALVEGGYAGRAVWQVPLVLGIALVGLALAGLFVRQWRRARRGSRARLVLLARFAMLGLVPLYGLRLVSLHQVDMVLYSGPFRINWLLEAAICAAVGGSAVVYAWTRRARARPLN